MNASSELYHGQIADGEDAKGISSVDQPKREGSLARALGHGFVLLGVLSILDGFIVFIPSHVFPGTATTVVTRVIVSFLYGFVGKGVAGLWEETPPQIRASQRLS